MSRRWSGGKTWEPWRDLGGVLSADPECILVGSANAACFGRSPKGELIAFLPDPAGKSGGWSTLGGRIEGKPSCVRLKSGEAACVSQSRGGRLHMWRGMPLFAQNAGLTTSIDDVVSQEPACALQAATLVCFTRNGRRQLVRRSLGADADTSHDGPLETPPVSALMCLSMGTDGLGCALTDTDQKLHFASNQELDAGIAEQPETAADQGAEGSWYLSNLGSGGTCRVMLSGDIAFGAKRLRVGPLCRGVGLPARPVQWDQDESELLFLAGDGKIVMRFRSTQTGRWISPRRRAAFMLTREPPEDVGDLTPSQTEPTADPALRAEMFGPWRVFAGNQLLCALRLTNARTEAGFAVEWEPGCEGRFTGIRYWTESDAALVFVGPGNIVVARFDSAGPGAWRTQNYGGLSLKR